MLKEKVGGLIPVRYVEDWGVEVEVVTRHIEARGQFHDWMIKPEGSIVGVEFVLRRPQNLPELTVSLNQLEGYLKGARVKPDFHASTHIHQNLVNKTWNDVLGQIVAFTIAEPVLLRMCGQERDGNLFCLSSYDTGDLRFGFQDFLFRILTKQVRLNRQVVRGKYASLNFETVFRLGTLEYRIFPSTVTAAPVLEWISWIENLEKIVQQNTDPTFSSMIEAAADDPGAFVRQVVGKVPAKMLGPTSQEILVRQGCISAHELVPIIEQAHAGTLRPAGLPPVRENN